MYCRIFKDSFVTGFFSKGQKMFKQPIRNLMFAGMLSLLCAGNAIAFGGTSLTPVERAVPPFSLLGVEGEVYDPEVLKGKTWLINFWAVWCAPCLEELPALNRAWEQLEKHDVGMLAINIGEEADAIEQFLKEHDLRIDFPIVIGDKIRSLSNWEGRGLPHTVVVNAEGQVVYEAIGPREWDDQGIIDTIIALNDSGMKDPDMKDSDMKDSGTKVE